MTPATAQATLDSPLQVHVYQFCEFFPVRQPGAIARQNIRTGIVHPDIDSAKLGGDRVNQTAHGIGFGNIRLYGNCLSGKPLYFTDYLLRLIF